MINEAIQISYITVALGLVWYVVQSIVKVKTGTTYESKIDLINALADMAVEKVLKVYPILKTDQIHNTDPIPDRFIPIMEKLDHIEGSIRDLLIKIGDNQEEIEKIKEEIE